MPKLVFRVSADGKSVYVEEAKVEVRTETMKWQEGRLVPTHGVRDPRAEEMAHWFTEYYEAIAHEQPVFFELKQAFIAIGLMRWLRQQGIQLSLQGIEGRFPQYEIPKVVPALTIKESRSFQQGQRTYLREVQIYGGTDLGVRPQAVKDNGRAQALKEQALQAAAHAQGATGFAWTAQGKGLMGVVLPTAETRQVGSFTTAYTDLLLEAGAGFFLPVTRFYNSFHNEPSPFGRGWSFNLPRLAFRNPLGEGRQQYLTIRGQPGRQVLVQHFTLQDDLGSLEESFTEPFVDQELHQIGFVPRRSSAFRGLYPQDDRSYLLRWHNGQTWRFDPHGRLVEQQTSMVAVSYRWEGKWLVALTLTTREGKKIVAQVTYDDAGRVRTIVSSQGARATYAYTPDGNLESVRTPHGTSAYRYNLQYLLTHVLINGRPLWEGRYDALGHLVWQKDQNGQQTDIVIGAEDTGRTITFRGGGGIVKQSYDDQGRVVQVEGGADEVWYSYFPDGGLKRVEWIEADGSKRTWEGGTRSPHACAPECLRDPGIPL